MGKTDRPRDDLLQCFDCSLSLHDPEGNDLENRPHFRHWNLATPETCFPPPGFCKLGTWENDDFARAMCLCMFMSGYSGNNDVFCTRNRTKTHVFLFQQGKHWIKLWVTKPEWMNGFHPFKKYYTQTQRLHHPQKKPGVSHVKCAFSNGPFYVFHT